MNGRLIRFFKEGTPIRFKPYREEWADAIIIKDEENKLILYTQNTNNSGHDATFLPGTIIFGHEVDDNCWYPELHDQFELMEDVQLKNY